MTVLHAVSATPPSRGESRDAHLPPQARHHGAAAEPPRWLGRNAADCEMAALFGCDELPYLVVMRMQNNAKRDAPRMTLAFITAGSSASSLAHLEQRSRCHIWNDAIFGKG